MAMDAKALYRACLQQATAMIAQVRTAQFEEPTPDTDWTVHDLVSHMLYELSWVADLLAGKSIAEVDRVYDGELFGTTAEELRTHWHMTAARAQAAIERCRLQATAHLSYADVTNEEYLRQAGSDELIHAWDLGKALGIATNLDPALIRAVYAYGLTQEADIRTSGLFGEPIGVADDAGLQTKLLALYGRRADWRTPLNNF